MSAIINPFVILRSYKNALVMTYAHGKSVELTSESRVHYLEKLAKMPQIGVIFAFFYSKKP